MTERIIYQLKDLRRSCGQDEILKGITLSLREGAKIAIIGRDGTANSTLLRIIAGEDTEFEGIAKAADDEVSIGYLSLEPPLDDELTVWGHLQAAIQHLRNVEAKYNEVCMDMEGREQEFQQLKDLMDHHDVWNLNSRLEQAAGALCLPPPDTDVKDLSPGERRCVALCKLLLAQPDMLLLDEPTHRLDAATAEWLGHHLAAYQGMVMLITHDRYFLDNVVGWMLEVERGKGIPYEGNYSNFLEDKQKKFDEDD